MDEGGNHDDKVQGSYVGKATFELCREGHDREMKNIKERLNTLDGRIWMILGGTILTVVLTALNIAVSFIPR